MERFYLDHAATTPLDPGAFEAMLPWLRSDFGNPSSLHEEGRRSRHAIDEAREIVASRLGSLFGEAHFTSSGTESCNLALLGCARAALENGTERRRIIAGAAEHHALLHVGPLLTNLGFKLDLIPVDSYARIDLNALERMVDEDTLLVSVMTANNELGTIQPVVEACRLSQSVGALFHTDAVQTFGSDPRTVDELGCDLLSASAHKLHGPKGVGLLYIRSGTPLLPIMVGGGQEREIRAGTENVAAIVGFGAALRASSEAGAKDSSPRPKVTQEPILHVREAFLAVLHDVAVRSVPPNVPTIPSHAHVRFPGTLAETLLIKLDRLGISASSGAACSSGSIEPSHVLLASGFPESEARECIRFTFGRDQNPAFAVRAATCIRSALTHNN